MLTLTTNLGNTYDADFAYGPLLNGRFIAQIRDERALSIIALEFEGLDWLSVLDSTVSPEPIEYRNFSELWSIERMISGIVKIELAKRNTN